MTVLDQIKTGIQNLIDQIDADDGTKYPTGAAYWKQMLTRLLDLDSNVTTMPQSRLDQIKQKWYFAVEDGMVKEAERLYHEFVAEKARLAEIAATEYDETGTDYEKVLRNLLATLNGDGGHFAHEHGVQVAADTAERAFYEMREKAWQYDQLDK